MHPLGCLLTRFTLLLLHFAVGVAKRNVYWPRPSVCTCLCVTGSLCVCPIFLHYCTVPDVTLDNGIGGAPRCAVYWADLKSAQGFVAMTTHATNAKCQRGCLYLLYGWLTRSLHNIIRSILIESPLTRLALLHCTYILYILLT